MLNRIRGWNDAATGRVIMRRALIACIAVGFSFAAVNHADDLLAGSLTAGLAIQLALTLLIPVGVVAVLGAAAVRGRGSVELADYRRVEELLESTNRFPDENPNPVLRISLDGRLVYANPASEPITAELGVAAGGALPAELFAELAAAASARPARTVDMVAGLRTYAVLPVSVRGLDVLNLYGTDVTAARVINKFPDLNPSPVMRMSPDGTLAYANAAAGRLTSALRMAVGDGFPADLLGRIRKVCAEGGDPIEVAGEGRTWALQPVHVPEFDVTNIYAIDVTARKAINKFPDQNPNPVLRVARDGTLLYANPASALVKKAFGAEIGDVIPGEMCDRITQIAEAGSPETIEIVVDDHVIMLLVAGVFEFDFINIYGTDVTAARQIEIAHHENERLLLNILPAAIADRLRKGENLIADKFDEMTVLFADVVGFTQLSMQMAPSELVDMLNRVFSICDQLADKHGLEKIKTIGDAYMVVGGLAPHADDHVAQVAEMGLEMLSSLEDFRAESGIDIHFRVGMHAGPAVAGVVGIRKFIYDVWGETVNTASRMESHGVQDRIQVTESTYEKLQGRYAFEPRGEIEIRGRGQMPTYFLLSRVADAAPVGSA